MMDKADVDAFVAQQREMRDYYDRVSKSQSASIELRRAALREVERLNRVIRRYAKGR